jgi:hypothetical protein
MVSIARAILKTGVLWRRNLGLQSSVAKVDLSAQRFTRRQRRECINRKLALGGMFSISLPTLPGAPTTTTL